MKRTDGAKNRRTVHDVLLCCAVLAAALALWALLPGRGEGAYAEVLLEGETCCVLPLDTDARTDIGGRCTVIIENGECRVEDAVCRGKLCEKHAPIRMSGQTICCMPGRVVVRIIGDEDGVDIWL